MYDWLGWSAGLRWHLIRNGAGALYGGRCGWEPLKVLWMPSRSICAKHSVTTWGFVKERGIGHVRKMDGEFYAVVLTKLRATFPYGYIDIPVEAESLLPQTSVTASMHTMRFPHLRVSPEASQTLYKPD